MRILILGGDGFCGWPTSLHLSAQGHEVAIVDNLARRKIDIELEAESLTPISPLGTRLAAWQEVTGNEIPFHRFDVAEHYRGCSTLFREFRPDAVVHFAEQRAAPYSMKDARPQALHGRQQRQRDQQRAGRDRRGRARHPRRPPRHDGRLRLRHRRHEDPRGLPAVKVETDEGEHDRAGDPVPGQPGQHLPHDQDPGPADVRVLRKNDQVRVTDLHQGIVWGTQTEETRLDERLINRFDYDGDYGTVLNRFLMQAAVGYPLTVHGTGGQTRAFIHIQDTVRCIQLAIENPPARGERVRVFNQMTETHRVRDLAKLVAELTGAEIDYVDNPRKEAAENELFVANDNFLELGLEPITLEDGLLTEVTEIAKALRDRCDTLEDPVHVEVDPAPGRSAK